MISFIKSHITSSNINKEAVTKSCKSYVKFSVAFHVMNVIHVSNRKIIDTYINLTVLQITLYEFGTSINNLVYKILCRSYTIKLKI